MPPVLSVLISLWCWENSRHCILKIKLWCSERGNQSKILSFKWVIYLKLTFQGHLFFCVLMTFLDVSYFWSTYNNYKIVHSSIISNMDTNTFLKARKQLFKFRRAIIIILLWGFTTYFEFINVKIHYWFAKDLKSIDKLQNNLENDHLPDT